MPKIKANIESQRSRLLTLWIKNESRISVLCNASQHDVEYLRLLEVANRRKHKVDQLNAPKVHALSLRSKKILDRMSSLKSRKKK